MTNLPERIKQLRKSAGLTQSEFGALFGVAKSTVCLYENGRNTPNDDIKMSIANYFGVSMDYLMGKTDQPAAGSCTPPAIEDKISDAGLNMFHAYLDLSSENQARVNDYVQMLSEWESAYSGKNKP